VPFCRDSWSVRFPTNGAILSGGGDGAFRGATGTVGLAGVAGCEFCASAGGPTRIKAVSENVRSMVRYPSSAWPPRGAMTLKQGAGLAAALNGDVEPVPTYRVRDRVTICCNDAKARDYIFAPRTVCTRQVGARSLRGEP
jgi:hypothetical protein